MSSKGKEPASSSGSSSTPVPQIYLCDLIQWLTNKVTKGTLITPLDIKNLYFLYTWQYIAMTANVSGVNLQEVTLPETTVQLIATLYFKHRATFLQFYTAFP